MKEDRSVWVATVSLAFAWTRAEIALSSALQDLKVLGRLDAAADLSRIILDLRQAKPPNLATLAHKAQEKLNHLEKGAT